MVGGATVNRGFGRLMLNPNGRENDEAYDAAVFYGKDAFQALNTMDALIDPDPAVLGYA